MNKIRECKKICLFHYQWICRVITPIKIYNWKNHRAKVQHFFSSNFHEAFFRVFRPVVLHFLLPEFYGEISPFFLLKVEFIIATNTTVIFE